MTTNEIKKTSRDATCNFIDMINEVFDSEGTDKQEAKEILKGRLVVLNEMIERI